MSSILTLYDKWARARVPEPHQVAAYEFFRRHHLHWVFCTTHENSTCHNNKCIFAAITWQFAKRNGHDDLAARLVPELPTVPVQQRLYASLWKQVEEMENLHHITFPFVQPAYSDTASARGWAAFIELMSKL